MRMVGWYDPRQLAKTGVEVAISTIFGRHSDQRLVEAMAFADKKEPAYYDYTYYYQDDGAAVCELDKKQPRDSIWIDYVGDVGDGWNSTYAVAHYLTGSLSLQYSDGKNTFDTTEVQRGEVLIFGGDEVYPTASREVYKDRLVTPYETATRTRFPPFPKGPFKGKDREGKEVYRWPHVFALPGNHDWYDSLVAFTRLFTAHPWFAGWRTRQTRSYFALKLPHNWWLLGTDVQLGSDIDKPQMKYFEGLVAEMDAQQRETGEPARIILCHAEPHWIRAAQYGGDDPNYNESNLKVLEKRLGKSVAVFIAGDLHHYRRHESEDKSTQKITAGGGGAFLHPTHPGILGTSLDHLVEKGLTEDGDRNFSLQGCFPSTKDSRRATWRNLMFPIFCFQGNQSWSFGLVIAGLYLLLTLPLISVIDNLTTRREQHFWYVTYTVLETLKDSPMSLLLILATVVGFVFFTDTHSKLHRWIMGGLHGIAHCVAAIAIALLNLFLVAGFTDQETWTLHIPWPGGYSFPADLRFLLVGVLIVVLGFIVGSFIMGAYLLLSMNFFGRHGNEAFSSLGIEDWKNFLRLHIDEHGDLTIYPVGIRRVPRKWKAREGQEGPELVPDPADRRATRPELIEMPIVMKRAQTETGVKTTSPSPVPAGASAGG